MRLTGYDSDSLVLSYTRGGLSTGATYKFRYRVRNVYGWSEYSQVLTAVATRVPSKPQQPSTTNSGTAITIAWVEPYNGGSPILDLTVEVRGQDGTFHEELLYCDAGETDTRSDSYCVIPMSQLTASPFNLEQGDKIVARMTVTNVAGDSPISDDTELVDITYALAMTIPHKPANPPQKGDATTTSQVEVLIDVLTGDATGGSAILSYHIVYQDPDTGDSWIELQGASSNALTTSYTVMGAQPAKVYSFKYRARNIFGWSAEYSDIAQIATIIAPAVMDPSQVSSTVSGTNIVLTWSAPAENGAQLLEYEVYFAESTAVDATFSKTDSYCASVLGAEDCAVPFEQFKASNSATVFSYVQGEAIRIKVRARNAMGWAELGEPATGSLV